MARGKSERNEAIHSWCGVLSGWDVVSCHALRDTESLIYQVCQEFEENIFGTFTLPSQFNHAILPPIAPCMAKLI
jgi:hypothetical protein